jgi:predicted RNA-binding Zn ribbon-like protein
VNFNSHMDIVVAMAVRLVNVLTAGEACGQPYQPPGPAALPSAVAGLLGEAGYAQQVPEPDAVELAGFAVEMRAVFEAVARGDIGAAAARVNALLAATGAHPSLDHHDGEPWHLHFRGWKDSVATGWAAGCATGLAVVLGSGWQARLGVCAAPRCDRVYVDTSRNGTRRFCGTSCQNRVKAAAFRARGA